MHVALETGTGLERQVLVDIPAETVTTAVDEKLRELAPKVKIDGFRPGKVPLRIVRQRFYRSAWQDVASELLESTYPKAIQELALDPASQPNIEFREAAEKDGLSYTATIEVMPEIKLQAFTDQRLIDRQCTISEADIDDMIHTLRTQNTTQVDVERPAALEDTLYLDLSWLVAGNDKPFTESNAELKLGSGAIAPGLDTGLIGACAGDERILDLTIPDDEDDEESADELVQYTVKVLRVTESQLPELNTDFIQSLNIEDGTEASLREEVTDNLNIEVKRRLEQLRKDDAFQLLRDNNPLEIPKVLVEQQAKTLRNHMLERLGISIPNVKDDWLPTSTYTPQARQQIHLNLLFPELIQQHNLTATDEDIQHKAQELTQTYQEPEKAAASLLQDPEQRNHLANIVLEQKIVDWVFQQVTVETQSISFTDLKNPPPTAEDEEADAESQPDSTDA